MIDLLSSSLWPEIETYAYNSKRKIVAAAYVSNDIQIKFNKGDILIVDASDECISSGSTSRQIIKSAIERKARVYSLKNLHAKIYILDDILFIGSSNISRSSKYKLHEVGLISDDNELIKKARKIVNEYVRISKRIDYKFLKHIYSIKVKKIFPLVRSNQIKEKPKLIDLLIKKSPIVNDYVIFLYENDATLKSRDIRRQAKKKGFILPPAKNWTWYEDTATSETRRLYKRYFQKSGLKAIGFLVKSNNNAITKFIRVDESIQIYINHFTVENKIASNFIDDYRTPFTFNNGTLIKRINKLLDDKPIAGIRLANKPAWIVPAIEFTKLLGF